MRLWRLKEEGAQDRGGDNQEDTRAEPACSGFRCIGVARTEFIIDFDTADQPDDCADGVDELRAGIEVGRYHVGGFGDSTDAVALCEGACGSHDEGRRHKNLFLCHC